VCDAGAILFVMGVPELYKSVPSTVILSYKKFSVTTSVCPSCKPVAFVDALYRPAFCVVPTTVTIPALAVPAFS